MSLSVDEEKCLHPRKEEEKIHLISYHSQNSENLSFSTEKRKIREQTQGGSTVQTLLRTSERPGQIQNTGSRTSHRWHQHGKAEKRTQKKPDL